MTNETKTSKPKVSELPFTVNIDDAGLRPAFDAMVLEFTRKHCNQIASGVVLNIKGKVILRHAIDVVREVK